MLYIKIDPCDRETHCNTSYHTIGISGSPQAPLRDLRAPGGALKSEFDKFEGLLTCYISKLIPVIGKLIATHLIIRLMCQGLPRPLKGGHRAPGGPLKFEFVKFEGLLACYISKSIPVLGKHILS